MDFRSESFGLTHLTYSSEIKIQKRDYSLDKCRKFPSSSDPLIHCRKVKRQEEGKGKGDRGRKLSQHTQSSPTPKQVCHHCLGLFTPSHRNAF